MTNSDLEPSITDDDFAESEDDVSGNIATDTEQPAREVSDADAVESLRGLVQYVVENLVDQPDRTEIAVEQRGNVVALGVRLPEDELGKVIGRGGRIAKSIRTALMIAGSMHHLRVSLDIDASDSCSEDGDDSDSVEVPDSVDEPDSIDLQDSIDLPDSATESES